MAQLPKKVDAYAHRSYRSKYVRGYGAEGVATGKTEIGEMKPMQAPEQPGPFHMGPDKDPGHTKGLSPKDQTSKKDDAENKKETKLSHKTKPNPF